MPNPTAAKSVSGSRRQTAGTAASPGPQVFAGAKRVRMGGVGEGVDHCGPYGSPLQRWQEVSSSSTNSSSIQTAEMAATSDPSSHARDVANGSWLQRWQEVSSSSTNSSPIQTAEYGSHVRSLEPGQGCCNQRAVQLTAGDVEGVV